MSLTVQNKQKVLFVLQLPAGFESEHPECQGSKFTMHQAVELPEGGSGVRVIERELPGSITWLPGESKDGLPLELSQIPEFKSARDAGKLIVIQQAKASVPPPPSEDEQPAEHQGDDR